jgi:integrase
MPAFLAGDLAGYVVGKVPGELVFTGRHGGVLRNLNFRRDHFDAAATAAGLDGLTPHELRHTAASLAEVRGIAFDATSDADGDCRSVWEGMFRPTMSA